MFKLFSMPSILAFATARLVVSVVISKSDPENYIKLTVGAVEEQNRVSATKDRNQSKIHLHGVSLLGMRERLNDAVVIVDTVCCCRLCDELLVGLHDVLGTLIDGF
jgi:hypothetical protein